MINSLFMLGSSYNGNKNISRIFMVSWIIYMFINYNFSLSIIFPLINATLFLVITILINCINNRTINTILSIFSILIWSILIDIICFYMYPAFVQGKSIYAYIFQGILFNGKYVFYNIVSIILVNFVKVIVNKYTKISSMPTRCEMYTD